jgi:hypothetical protein
METRIEHIKDRIEDALNAGSTTYLDLNSSQLEQVATEYALAIQDYSDSDDMPSSRTIGSVKYYGMELLPFLREVYIQAGYDDKDRDNDDGDNDPDTGMGDKWELHADSQAMAVEIANPFDRLIKDVLLNDRIQIAVVQGDPPDDVSTHILSGMPDLDSQEKVVLYSNPISPVVEGTYGADLNADLGLSGPPSPVDLGDGTLKFNVNDTDDVTVELRVDVDGTGTWVTYDRLTVTDFRLPLAVDHQEAPNPDTTAKAHGQGSMARDGQDIRYLSNQGKDLVDPVRLPDNPGYKTRVTGNAVDELETDEKGISGDDELDSFQIPIANRPIFSVAELGWILMFGFTDEPDGDFPQRFSGEGPGSPALPDATRTHDPRRRFLTFNTELPYDGTEVEPDEVGIPHAAIVLDEFTTLSPRHDGVDNDNDDGDNDPNTADDNEAEQVVPATININTAPLHILTLAAPLPEPIDDVQALMEGVVDYRDNPDNRIDITGYSPADGLRQEKGIASTAELLLVNPDLVANGGPVNPELDMTRYTDTQQPMELDLYPMPEQSGAVQYTSPMEAEGRMARFQFLAQAFTTRSDFYVAYVVILGYDSADFTKDPAESKRFYAIFDRSRIVASVCRDHHIGEHTVPGVNDRVEVLAVRDAE